MNETAFWMEMAKSHNEQVRQMAKQYSKLLSMISHRKVQIKCRVCSSTVVRDQRAKYCSDSCRQKACRWKKRHGNTPVVLKQQRKGRHRGGHIRTNDCVGLDLSNWSEDADDD